MILQYIYNSSITFLSCSALNHNGPCTIAILHSLFFNIGATSGILYLLFLSMVLGADTPLVMHQPTYISCYAISTYCYDTSKSFNRALCHISQTYFLVVDS